MLGKGGGGVLCNMYIKFQKFEILQCVILYYFRQSSYEVTMDSSTWPRRAKVNIFTKKKKKKEKKNLLKTNSTLQNMLNYKNHLVYFDEISLKDIEVTEPFMGPMYQL